MKSQKPLSRKENIVVQEIDGEVLVYDLGENRAVCLNETSALVWQACDGTKTPAEISKFIGEKINTPANEDLVWLALDQLKKEKLIQNSEELPDHFAGMSRRDVIKKVALSSLIALPVIMAVTSPVAGAAGSFCGVNLNVSCECNLAGGVPAGPRPAGPGEFCVEVNPIMCTANGAAGPCQCFVPGGTAQNGATLNYPGTCLENV